MSLFFWLVVEFNVRRQIGQDFLLLGSQIPVTSKRTAWLSGMLKRFPSEVEYFSIYTAIFLFQFQ